MSSSISSSNVKKYLSGFFLFILFAFLLDRGLFLLIHNLEANFYTSNQFEERFARFVKDKHYSTLILGTSRTYEAIHPVYLEEYLGQKAYKETSQGKGPKYNYYFYKLYKRYAGIPKVVIYGVDYFIYNVTTDPKWMARFTIEKQDETENVDLFSSPLLLLEYKKKIDNFHNNVLIRLKEKKSPQVEAELLKDFIRIQEYTGIEVVNKKLITRCPHTFIRQIFIRYPGIEGRYLRKLLDELAKDKVTVILVGLPDYYGTFKTNFQRERFAFHLKTLKRNYKKLHVYNYNRPKKFDLSNPAYFNDGGWGLTNSHLSKTGAREFNRLLCEEIKKHYQ
jgi:glycogen synthase